MTDAKPADSTKPGESGSGDSDGKDGGGGLSQGSPSAQLWTDMIAKLRGRADLTAKALGGVGMTAVTAVGIAKIGDLFPIPPGHDYHVFFLRADAPHLWFWAAITGFVALAVAILIVTFRLWSVNKPVLMRSSLEAMMDPNVGGGSELSEEEEKEARVLYQETARLNGVRSLSAYEAREQRLRRIAEWTGDDDKRAKLESAAQQISSDIQETFARASLVVIRRRTSNAIRGWQSIGAYVLLVGGIVLFALGTDYVSSERSEQISIAKNCADARKAGADSATLPAICGPDPSAPEPGKTSAAEERAKAATSLGEPLQQCLARIRSGDAPAGSCQPIAQAMSSLVTAP